MRDDRGGNRVTNDDHESASALPEDVVHGLPRRRPVPKGVLIVVSALGVLWILALAMHFANRVEASRTRQEDADKQRQWAEQVAKAKAEEAKNDEQRRVAREAAAVAHQQEMAALTRARPSDRETFLRDCLARHCPESERDDVIGTAANASESDRLTRIANAESLVRTIRGRGPLEERVSQGSMLLERSGKRLLEHLPAKTSFGEAMKDPDDARGRQITFSGTVVEIQCKRGICDGGIANDSLQVLRFVTTFPTDGVVQHSWVTFRGIFVDEIRYPNVSGGETHAAVGLGYLAR